MMRWRDLTLLPALLALLSLGLTAGCDADADNPASPPGQPQTRLRVVHASPDAPLVDIYVNKGDSPVVTALGYGVTSDDLAVDAGTYSVEIRGHGADPASPAVHTQEGLMIAEGMAFTAVAVGLLESSDPLARFRILAFEEGFADPGAGNVAARIVHAAPDAPAVTLDVASDGTFEVTDLARFAETGPAGVALPAGQPVRIGVRAGEPPARVAVFTTPALPQGAGLFVIATGLLGGDPQGDGFSLLVVGPEGSIGLVRQDG